MKFTVETKNTFESKLEGFELLDKFEEETQAEEFECSDKFEEEASANNSKEVENRQPRYTRRGRPFRRAQISDEN